ncbi:hypothetical protein X798_01057 [Onchocerca flexuosa]|uniref:Uncharacterized protein n=1 Tax=Onchocerca flexuosa TaxID=387005 RepID=A0A238C3Z4_9BILA|nr:hypothetical protein X798_01057 [Onchocerca flexuosa]
MVLVIFDLSNYLSEELIVATIDDAQIRCCISGAVSRWQDNRWMSGIALLGNFLSLAREFWCLLALDTNVFILSLTIIPNE